MTTKMSASGPDDPLRVFHVMRTYGNNGGEQQLAQMFGQIDEDIAEHFVFLFKDRLCESLFAASSSIKFHRLFPLELKPRYYPWLELLMVLPLLPWMQIKLIFLLLRGGGRVCVVHGFQAALVAWPAAVLMRKTGFGYIHRITKSPTGRNALFRLIYAPFRKLAGVSQAVTRSLSNLAPESKLTTIENGVDIERIQNVAPGDIKGDIKVVIAVGRLLPHKGQELLVEAFCDVVKEAPKTELWIVGEGDSRARIEHAVAHFGLEKQVHLLGRREDIPELLSRASIFVHASDREGMSNSVLEAMAAGLPSVVVAAPGVSECHENGVTGFVVERNPEVLRRQILMLLDDKNLRTRMGKAASLRVNEKYSIQVNRKKFLAFYRELQT